MAQGRFSLAYMSHDHLHGSHTGLPMVERVKNLKVWNIKSLKLWKFKSLKNLKPILGETIQKLKQKGFLFSTTW